MLSTQLLLAASLATVLLSGCFTANIVDREVKRHYGTTVIESKKKAPEQVVVTSALSFPDSSPSLSTHKTKIKLPLIVYWSWDYKTTCQLNPQIALNSLTKTITHNRALKDKINNRRLELSIDSVPNKFSIMDKGHLIFLIYGFSWDVVRLNGENNSLSVRYRLTGGDAGKNGVIHIPYKENDAIRLHLFKGPKRAASQYLADYDAQLTAMGKQLIEKMLQEL